jgi:cytochrome c-type biogenesis protein CcmH
MTADAWANYADALASTSGGHLGPASEAAIDAALKIDPSHIKGLWLKATSLYEQHRNAEALVLWERLATLVPSDSPDAKLIAGNLAEARTLAAAPAAAPSAAHVSGEIDIDPKLKLKITAGTSLFVFAKAPGAAGPPLAVVRTSVGSWPHRFTLDDSNAMLPQHNLSSVAQVKVEARLSLSGQAIAHSGDMQGSSGILDPKSDAPVRVLISEVVP